MREFFYKSSFIRYYSALNSKRISYKSNGFWPMIIFGSLMLFGLFCNVVFFTNIFVELFCIVSLVLFLLSIGNGIRLGMTPNLAHTIPVSHQKKTAWHMLCPLYAVAYGLAIFLLASLLFYGIICLSWFIRGLPVEAFVDELEMYYLREIGWCGGLFALIYMIICYSVGTVAGLMKRRLYRNITLTVFAVVNFIFFLLMNVTTPAIDYDGSIFFITCSPFIQESYVALPNLWVILIIFGLVALGLLAWAIWATYKRFRPKKY